MGDLFCNHCWQPLQPGQAAYATACSHLFGEQCGCAKQVFQSSSPGCPVCNAVLTQEDVKKVIVLGNPESSSIKLMQAGQLPAVALGTALDSIHFYVEQQGIYSDLRIQRLEQKMERMQAQCKKKLGEVHSAYKTVKRKYEDVVKQHQGLQGDHQELGEKYNQKALECKKLKEVVPLLHHERDAYRRAAEQVAHQAGIPLASIPALAASGQRPPSAGGGGGHSAGMLGLAQGHVGLGRRVSLGPSSTPLADHGQAYNLGGGRRAPTPRNNPSPAHSPALTLGLGGLDYSTPAHLAQPHPRATSYTAQAGHHRSLPQHGSRAPGMMPNSHGDRRISAVFAAQGGSGMGRALGLPRDFGGSLG